MKERFDVIGKIKGRCYWESKCTLGGAMRKAKRYVHKRNCEYALVFHIDSCNVIYKVERNVENVQ